jgi:uncharacterized repeat protein (TIGR03803 family)
MKSVAQRRNLVSVVGRRAVIVSLALAVVLASIVAGSSSAHAQTYEESVLYSFTGADEKPEGGLIMDAKGNLCGTTSQGGASNDGVVFKLTP